MVLPLFLFSIFKNLKETIEIVVKKILKKYIKKILLWKNWVHIKKKKTLWPRRVLNPQTSDPKSSALPTKPSGMC